MIEADYYAQTTENSENLIEEEEEHDAARDYKDKLTAICALHQSWCDKITWS
jgi:hypothetical protein